MLKQLLFIRSFGRVDGVGQEVRHRGELIKRYDAMSGSPFPGDFKVTILIDLCLKESKEFMAFKNNDVDYKKSAREDILNCLRRKRRITEPHSLDGVDELCGLYRRWG